MIQFQQVNMFAQEFKNIDIKLKCIAFKILDTLYLSANNGLNIKEINAVFKKNNIRYVRNALKELEKLYLIEQSNTKCEKQKKDILLPFLESK